MTEKKKTIHQLGGMAVRDKYGSEHYQRMGKLSGESKRKKKEELKQSSEQE